MPLGASEAFVNQSFRAARSTSRISDVVDVCVVTISNNFNPASLLYLSRYSTMNQKKPPSKWGLFENYAAINSARRRSMTQPSARKPAIAHWLPALDRRRPLL